MYGCLCSVRIPVLVQRKFVPMLARQFDSTMPLVVGIFTAQMLQDAHLTVPIPGWKLHPLESDLAGHWSVWVSGNWRLTFTFEDNDAVLVDYQDYH